MSIDLKPGQFYGVPQFGASGCGFDIRALAASAREDDVRIHTHQDAHFVLVLSGTYISSARGVSEFSRAPTLIFNPSGTTHRDRFANGTGTFVTVSVAAATLRDLLEMVPLATHATQLRSADELTAAFRIVRELRATRDAVVLVSLAWELLAAIADRPRLSSEPPRWARRAYELIMDRATEAAQGVGDVAATIGVHPVHLARVFRGAWGCSPGELVRWRRVDRAADQLRRTKMSVAQIAAGAGFVDQSHMTRAFYATYGVTPGAYRRKHVSRIQAPEAGF